MARAVGGLDRALELLVDAHVELCRACTGRLAALDELGGALMRRRAAEVPVPEGLVDRVLSASEDAPEAQPLPDDDVLPMVLVEHFGPLEAMRWRWGAPGLARIDLLPQRDRLPLRLLRMAPGTRVAAHDHAGHERAVILAGGWRDFRGELRRGDFAVCGPEERGHTLEVDTDAPCIALVLNDAPIVAHARVHRWLAAWRGL
ncbi:MAG: cupin domain-containing protein [Alphaproteobacteria bacterium]|nr:cupin domain-containing protein [Alphaproteobacteria bacterium]